ncbi:MAG: glycerol-3-phosphate 1-O-acyltransferase PlsY [Oscillospiraceae bacterium]|jgi:glycerol-3-phosphate acyltransferase PlsY|nr:glycerol-3-phosphate 1-O-acyltransferase PlsY [Oscillospiraceae bacterium]
MELIKYILLIILSYLLGSFNFSIICSRRFKKSDVRDFGSGNAGITNYFRAYGSKTVFIVMIGDMGKCFLAAFVGGLLFGFWGRLIGGLFVMLGHLFPVFFKFKGGKGVLTTAATILAFDWRVFLIAFCAFLLIVFVTRFVSLGSVIAVCMVPPLIYMFYEGEWRYVGITALIALIVVFMHRQNIGRLINGTESKFTLKRK